MMVGILCVMNVLQPLCTYADELPQTSETVVETVAEPGTVQVPASEAATESESPVETESGTEAVVETAGEIESVPESELKGETASVPELQPGLEGETIARAIAEYREVQEKGIFKRCIDRKNML